MARTAAPRSATSSDLALSSPATRRSRLRQTIRKSLRLRTTLQLRLSSSSQVLQAASRRALPQLPRRRGIQLHSVKATLEADMDLQGILGIDDEVRNGFGAIRVHFDIRADASEDDIKALGRPIAEAVGRVRHHHQPDERLRHRQLTAAAGSRSECREVRDHRSSSAPANPDWP